MNATLCTDVATDRKGSKGEKRKVCMAVCFPI